jgi:hypothetical protein
MTPAPRPTVSVSLTPLAGAKIQLLQSLEASGSSEATLMADELLDARTLHELAARARDISLRLRESDGRKLAETFWSQAKEILTRWRDLAASGR